MTQEPNIFPYIARLLQGAEVVWKPLGEVCEFSNTGVDKKTIEGEKKVRLLNFVDVFHKQYITKETPTMIVSASDKKILDCNILKGDVFITPSSEILDEIGYSATAIEDIKGAVYSYHIMRLRVYNKEILHPEYLAYLFSSNSVRKQIRIKAQGITRFGLTLPRWKSIQIPLPPLSVQQEIVRILDKFTQLEAELEAELEGRKRQYEYYRNKLLTFNEIGGGTKVEWKTLEEVFEIIAGGDIPKDALSEIETNEYNIPILSNGINEKAIYGWTNISKINKPSLTISARGTIGWASYREQPFFPIVRLLVLTPLIEINLRYAYHFMKSIENDYKVPKVGIPQLTKPMIKHLKIPLPPLSEQQRIATILDKFDTLVNSISEGLPKEIALRRKQYEYYREKLLRF
ncbi:restriction endonuclease subunit S [Capnocytophaga granulosa]|uniref:restriction endonuclease subunit S n=1 Tax=Capnocytophaga granulosa TaxID=45242 RepID=UPI0023EFB7F4|nr:restriction endonuclease subunit S [Capnocytophaga granulosa]